MGSAWLVSVGIPCFFSESYHSLLTVRYSSGDLESADGLWDVEGPNGNVWGAWLAADRGRTPHCSACDRLGLGPPMPEPDWRASIRVDGPIDCHRAHLHP